MVRRHRPDGYDAVHRTRTLVSELRRVLAGRSGPVQRDTRDGHASTTERKKPRKPRLSPHTSNCRHEHFQASQDRGSRRKDRWLRVLKGGGVMLSVMGRMRLVAVEHPQPRYRRTAARHHGFVRHPRAVAMLLPRRLPARSYLEKGPASCVPQRPTRSAMLAQVLRTPSIIAFRFCALTRSVGADTEIAASGLPLRDKRGAPTLVTPGL